MRKVILTDSEWKIMKLLWQDSPLTMRNIEDALKEETGWTKNTIISFLKRMISKGAVYVENATPVKLYYPLLDKKQATSQETRSMLSKLYHGSVSLMVSNMLSQKELSDEEMDELLKILNEGRKNR